MTFCRWIVGASAAFYIWFIQWNSWSKIQLVLLARFPALTFTSNMTLMEPWQPYFVTDVTILAFLSSTVPFSTVTSRRLLHVVFACRGWFDVREPVILVGIFYIDLSCWQGGFSIGVSLRLDWDQCLKGFLVVAVIWRSLIVSQWPPRLVASVGHDIVVMSAFHSWMRHGGHHDGCRMRSRKCLPFRSTWFRLWFSWRFVLSCHLCLLVSCYGLVFCLLSFDCSFCLTTWYLYIFYFLALGEYKYHIM